MRRMIANRNDRKIKTADILIIFIIIIPIFLFSLKTIIDSNQKPNILNIIIYMVLVLSIGIGMFMGDLAKHKQAKSLWILSIALTVLGIFVTLFLTLLILKDIISLAFTASILIPLFLVFLVLQR